VYAYLALWLSLTVVHGLRSGPWVHDARDTPHTRTLSSASLSCSYADMEAEGGESGCGGQWWCTVKFQCTAASYGAFPIYIYILRYSLFRLAEDMLSLRSM
jgi:hypothetical protein